MKGITKFDQCYDLVFSYMWDVTTGGAINWRECYRGAKHFGRFCLSELDRKEELETMGETATVRRGLAVADSIITAWVFNVVEDCSDKRSPLPPELLEVIYRLLGCTHLTRDDNDDKMYGLRIDFEHLREKNTDLPTRATARDLGVDPATIVRWKKEPFPELTSNPYPEEYARTLELTKASDFAIRASRALRR